MKSNKLNQLINYRLKITLSDGRTLIGQFMAFDKHMNVVLADTEEIRVSKGKKGLFTEQKRTLGLIILRGESIISMSVESGPPPSGDNKSRLPASTLLGHGIGKAAGRGMPIGGMPSGPVRGIGGPAPFAAAAAPVSYVPPASSMPPAGRPSMPVPPGFRPPMMGMPPAGMPMPPGFRPPISRNPQ